MLCYIYYICIYAEGDSCASNSHNYTNDIGTLVVLKRTSQVSNGIISSGDSNDHHPPDLWDRVKYGTGLSPGKGGGRPLYPTLN